MESWGNDAAVALLDTIESEVPFVELSDVFPSYTTSFVLGFVVPIPTLPEKYPPPATWRGWDAVPLSTKVVPIPIASTAT